MRFVGAHEVMDWGVDEHCDHEEYDADILMGVARCWVCGHRWIQSDDEIRREREAQVAYDKQCAEWEAEQSKS